MRSANIVTCSFDAVEARLFRAKMQQTRSKKREREREIVKSKQAFFSAMGLGDDINGMVRVCPDPRPYRSEVACQAWHHMHCSAELWLRVWGASKCLEFFPREAACLDAGARGALCRAGRNIPPQCHPNLKPLRV